MRAIEIMDAIRMLAQSQGFYGRLLRRLNDLDEDDFNEVMEHLEAQNFSDAVDMVMFFET